MVDGQITFMSSVSLDNYAGTPTLIFLGLLKETLSTESQELFAKRSFILFSYSDV